MASPNRNILTALAAGLAVAACGGSRAETGTSPQEGTRLEVVNRSSSDMDVFVVRSGQRVRLGLAPSNETTSFTLLPVQIAGTGPARFQASPLAGFAQPISSEPVMLRAGDVITLNIPPP